MTGNLALRKKRPLLNPKDKWRNTYTTQRREPGNKLSSHKQQAQAVPTKMWLSGCRKEIGQVTKIVKTTYISAGKESV